jgi:hypothetical protein
VFLRIAEGSPSISVYLSICVSVYLAGIAWSLDRSLSRKYRHKQFLRPASEWLRRDIRSHSHSSQAASCKESGQLSSQLLARTTDPKGPKKDLVPEQLVSLSGEDSKLVTFRDLVAKDGTKLKELALAFSPSPPALEVSSEQETQVSATRPLVEASFTSSDGSNQENSASVKKISSSEEDELIPSPKKRARRSTLPTPKSKLYARSDAAAVSSKSVTRGGNTIKPRAPLEPRVLKKTDEKPLKCAHCDKGFDRQSHLYVGLYNLSPAYGCFYPIRF